MNAHPGPTASDGDATQGGAADIDDVFADLTAIDVIAGELVPRSRPSSGQR